ncbi:MAG: response regulator [Gammaproteobacteria bacterium]|nr:response regulator [Gammaproteobacteria bacterium]
MNTVLIIEDENDLRAMLCFNLVRNNFKILEAANTVEAKQQLKIRTPDIILLDVMMPGQSGFDFAAELSASKLTRKIPIIMLTARDSEEDKIRGLNIGADDYITKPFSPSELIARINAVLRRSQLSKDETESQELILGDLVLNNITHELNCQGKTIALSPVEFRLLSFFIANPKNVYSRVQLLDNVWGNDAFYEERTVDVTIRRLRKALEEVSYGSVIQTVRGVGYRLNKIQ